MVEPSDRVVLIGLEVNTQHSSGLVQLCYPMETLEPVLDQLNPMSGAKRRKEARRAAREGRAPEPEPKPAPEPVAPPISPDESVAQIAERRPADIAGVIQTLLSEAAGAGSSLKVAVLLAGLGQDLARKVLRRCTPQEREKAAEAIPELADSSSITVRQRDEVFAEVKERLQSGDYALPGAVRLARRLLQGSGSAGFSMLSKVDPNHIIPFISKEHPQTIALIMSQLDAKQAAGVLNGLREDLQADVAYRITHMENISPQVLRELEEALARDLEAILSGQITEVGGPKATAEILNRTGRTTEKRVLQDLDKMDPELAEDVRNQMFTFDDIANLTDREIQMILREVDTKDLAIALKGSAEKLKNRFYSNMSDRVEGMIKVEMDASGPTRMCDVEDIQLRIVHTVRQLEEKGQVTIVRGDDGAWV